MPGFTDIRLTGPMLYFIQTTDWMGTTMKNKFALLACVLLLAACSTTQKKPAPEPAKAPVEAPRVQIKRAPRLDDLAMLKLGALPERDGIREPFRFDRIIKVTKVNGLRYYFYRPDKKNSVVGFSVLNSGSPKINPVGLKRKGPQRQYIFLFADRARENIHLKINDDVKISGAFSQDNMFRELHFFPRKQLPALEVDQAKNQIKVTLPTGEPVLFDKNTMEVVGGALIEKPIDFNRSRHQRRNPQVRYKGDFLVVTVAQRGESPRRARIWGQNKLAEIQYPSKYKKSCKISPKYIWDQRPKKGDKDPRLTMLHKTDNELFTMIERRCGWNLKALKESSQVLVKANK